MPCDRDRHCPGSAERSCPGGTRVAILFASPLYPVGRHHEPAKARKDAGGHRAGKAVKAHGLAKVVPNVGVEILARGQQRLCVLATHRVLGQDLAINQALALGIRHEARLTDGTDAIDVVEDPLAADADRGLTGCDRGPVPGLGRIETEAQRDVVPMRACQDLDAQRVRTGLRAGLAVGIRPPQREADAAWACDIERLPTLCPWLFPGCGHILGIKGLCCP